MRIRTVRLDDEAEKALEEIVQATGLSISSTLKQGLLTLHNQLSQQASQSPYEIYAKLDLGPGGYAIAPLLILAGAYKKLSEGSWGSDPG